jgi:hypothetical protein
MAMTSASLTDCRTFAFDLAEAWPALADSGTYPRLMAC